MNNTPKKKTNLIRYTLLSIILFLCFFAFSKIKENNKLKDVFAQDKIELETELDKVVTDYKKLNTKNKKLTRRVITEINKIIALKDSVKKLNVENYTLIRKYRRRLSELQKENKHLHMQVDSLKTANEFLKQDYAAVNKILDENKIATTKLQSENSELAAKYQSLEAKIQPAKKVKISAINAIAMREKSGGSLTETQKSSKTDAFRINFKLLKNTIATPGKKKIHIQLQDNKDEVIAPKVDVELNNNLTIKASDELVADYYNQDVDVLSLILVDREKLDKGNYKVHVFIDGDYTSTSQIALK